MTRKTKAKEFRYGWSTCGELEQLEVSSELFTTESDAKNAADQMAEDDTDNMTYFVLQVVAKGNCKHSLSWE